MFDLGGGEMLLIGIVALVVVGPKELPALFRTVGKFTGKARSMAREFTSAMNAAADQSGMSELNKTLKGVTKPMSYAADRLRETTGLATSSLNSIKSPTIKPGGATEKLAEKLSADREATRLKIEEATAKAGIAKAEAAKAASMPTAEEMAEMTAPESIPASKPAPPRAPRKAKTAAPQPAPAPAPPRKPRAKAAKAAPTGEIE